MPMPTSASGEAGARASAARNCFSAAPGRRCSNSRQPSLIMSCGSGGPAGGEATASSAARWHFLYFFPEPQGHASLRPVWPMRALAALALVSKAAVAVSFFFFVSLMINRGRNTEDTIFAADGAAGSEARRLLAGGRGARHFGL